MNEDFSIRCLQPDDWQAFSGMRLYSLKECAAMFGSSYEQESQLTAEQWQARLRDCQRPVFGLFYDDKMIGLTAITAIDQDKGIAYMGMSYIVPDYRRRGLSAMFYPPRVVWAADRLLSCNRLRVAHRVGNVAAAAATKKAGFVYEKTDRRAWPDGTEGDQDWYHLNLDDVRRKKMAQAKLAMIENSRK